MLTSLDNDDMRILQVLQHDARLTNKEIADKIGKSVSPVFERIRRLEREGIILQYIAILDRRKINKSLSAYVNVKLKEHASRMMTIFQQEVVKFPEVMECYHMTGQYDYLLKVELKDMDEYYLFMTGKLANLPNIGNVQSFFVLHEAKKNMAYRMDALPSKPSRKYKKRHSSKGKENRMMKTAN